MTAANSMPMNHMPGPMMGGMMPMAHMGMNPMVGMSPGMGMNPAMNMGMGGMMPMVPMSPMMGMGVGMGMGMPMMMPMMMRPMTPIMTRMHCETSKDGFICRMVPMEGQEQTAMKECCEAINAMMAMGAPVMLVCNGVPMVMGVAR